ncbi:hypothetical protein B0O99DRAFT_589398 [Bisporella sp. PMI_857]|nr:hypothetical protein B0O99DRAFT_589398 [Bisporella sp. PMI_857]
MAASAGARFYIERQRIAQRHLLASELHEIADSLIVPYKGEWQTRGAIVALKITDEYYTRQLNHMKWVKKMETKNEEEERGREEYERMAWNIILGTLADVDGEVKRHWRRNFYGKRRNRRDNAECWTEGVRKVILFIVEALHDVEGSGNCRRVLLIDAVGGKQSVYSVVSTALSIPGMWSTTRLEKCDDELNKNNDSQLSVANQNTIGRDAGLLNDDADSIFETDWDTETSRSIISISTGSPGQEKPKNSDTSPSIGSDKGKGIKEHAIPTNEVKIVAPLKRTLLTKQQRWSANAKTHPTTPETLLPGRICYTKSLLVDHLLQNYNGRWPGAFLYLQVPEKTTFRASRILALKGSVVKGAIKEFTENGLVGEKINKGYLLSAVPVHMFHWRVGGFVSRSWPLLDGSWNRGRRKASWLRKECLNMREVNLEDRMRRVICSRMSDTLREWLEDQEAATRARRSLESQSERDERLKFWNDFVDNWPG